MNIRSRILSIVAGDELRVRRMVAYWGATAVLYVMAVLAVWVEVRFGQAMASFAILLSALSVAGMTVFYVLIRNYQRLGLTPEQLSLYQSRFAILCTCTGYTALGPLRGSSLVALFVVMTFSAFALEARKSRSLSIHAVSFLGLTMIAMPYTAPQFFDPKTELFHFTLAGSMLIVTGVLNGRLSDLRAMLKAQKTELLEAVAQIQTLATRDELTALPNRRFMSDLLNKEERRRTGLSAPACLALLDIDWFKRINDLHGHAAGDAVLRQFAAEGRQQLRENDVLARWGGEEFLLYLPNTGMDDARAVLERLRCRIQCTPCSYETRQLAVTFSAGLVELAPGESMEKALRRADGLLYRAKDQGRNAVVSEAGGPVRVTEPVAVNA